MPDCSHSLIHSRYCPTLNHLSLSLSTYLPIKITLSNFRLATLEQIDAQYPYVILTRAISGLVNLGVQTILLFLCSFLMLHTRYLKERCRTFHEIFQSFGLTIFNNLTFWLKNQSVEGENDQQNKCVDRRFQTTPNP